MSYCARSDIEGVFGVKNVTTWADLDNDHDEASITARIALAIAYAQGEVDDRLRGGPYSVPLSEPPPTSIIDVAAKMAGVWLYENRGITDFNPDTGQAMHRYQWMKRDAGQKLKEYRAGVRRLSITSKGTAPEYIPHEISDD